MNPADKRLGELLDNWLASLELHLGYSSLTAEQYQTVQPWPPHDRPSRWIIELAQQKARQLKEQHASRVAMGDAKFADALDLMNFLAPLMGSQHERRFIPLARPSADTGLTLTQEKPTLPAVKTDTAKLKTQGKSSARPAARLEGKSTDASAGRFRAEPRAVAAGAKGTETVVADARRLLGWGRAWHELPELICRMSGRPSLADVRRILRANKSRLESPNA